MPDALNSRNRRKPLHPPTPGEIIIQDGSQPTGIISFELYLYCLPCLASSSSFKTNCFRVIIHLLLMEYPLCRTGGIRTRMNAREESTSLNSQPQSPPLHPPLEAAYPPDRGGKN